MKKTKPKITDEEIMRALINQVQSAANGSVETQVTTFITKPMWKSFLRAIGAPANSAPTEWIGIEKTIRVYGSHTVIIPGKGMHSVSLKIERTF